MEPFHQLQRPGGVTAENSLFLDYATSSIITAPFKATSRQHYVVLASSLISLITTALAPLSSETFFVSLFGDCGSNYCYATWGIYTLLARTIEAILALIAILTALIIILGLRRDSGVFADPLSICGLATLINHPDVLREFRDIDSFASVSKMKRELAGLKFGLLMSFTDSDQCYGITIVSDRKIRSLDNDVTGDLSEINLLSEYGSLDQGGERDLGDGYTRQDFAEVDDSEDPRTVLNNDEEMLTKCEKTGKFHTKEPLTASTALMRSRKHTASTAESGESLARGGRDWWSIAEKILYVSAFAALGVLIAIIIYYHKSDADNSLTHFLNSQSFGVRLLMTIIGILVNLFFKYVDEDFRRLEPYRRLIAGPSLADDSILVPIWVSPYSAVMPALRRRHFLVASIATVAILSEFLPILLANVPASEAVTELARVICTWLSVAILALMLVCAFGLMLRPASALYLLPRRPENIGAVLRYIVGPDRKGDGSMLENICNLTFVSGRKRDQVVRRGGKRYQLGWASDGELCIDEDMFIRRSWR